MNIAGRARTARRFAVSALLVCAACTSGDAPPPSGSDASATLHPSAADSTGPRRIVALVPSLTDLAVSMGVADRFAARTDFDDHPRVAHLPSIGGGLDPNLEAIVGLGVDHVLMPSVNETPAVRVRLEELGVGSTTFPIESIDDLHTSLSRLGQLFGLERAADSVSAAIRSGLDDVRQRVAGREPVPVMYVVWPDPPMTTGAGTFIDEVIGIAGGRNVFEDSVIQWPTVGFEAIVARAPRAVLWPRGETTVIDVGQLRETPGWRDVEAVKNARVLYVDADLFNVPGPSVVEAARVLADLLHPPGD